MSKPSLVKGKSCQKVWWFPVLNSPALGCWLWLFQIPPKPNSDRHLPKGTTYQFILYVVSPQLFSGSRECCLEHGSSCHWGLIKHHDLCGNLFPQPDPLSCTLDMSCSCRFHSKSFQKKIKYIQNNICTISLLNYTVLKKKKKSSWTTVFLPLFRTVKGS